MSLALSQERLKQSPERTTTAPADNKKVPQGANTVENAESAFVGVTKHSAKMRRRLKRKQRKRSAATSRGNDGETQDTSSTQSDDGTPNRRVEDCFKPGAKKEFRSSMEHHRPATSSNTTMATTTGPKSPGKRDTRLDLVRYVQPKPTKTTICREGREYGATGKTMVEILSRIGEQASSPGEAWTSPRPGETEGRGEDGCAVSIFLDVSDDGWQTVSPSGLEDTISSVKAASERSTVQRERSRSPVVRLDVTKTLREGLSLRRSHSCSEMRRRTVLAEWEVVTTTSTEVIVTETGAASQRTIKSISSSENQPQPDLCAGNASHGGVGSETQIVEQDNSAHDSRIKILGLAENAVGHRRSKSNDMETRRDLAATTMVEMRAVSNPDKVHVQHSSGDVRSVSSTDVKFGTDQRATEINNQPADVVMVESESLGLSTEHLPAMHQLLEETVSEQKTPQPKVPAVSTYTLSEPSAVDIFKSIADREWQDRWTMGLGAEPVGYSMVDFVENIRLTAAGHHLNPEEPEYIEERAKCSQQNSVNECGEVLYGERVFDDNENDFHAGVFVQSRYTPPQVHCQSIAYDAEATNRHQNSCSNTTRSDNFDDNGTSEDESQETQVALSLEDASEEHDESEIVAGQTNLVVDISQPRVKEDEDSEEKEADEAEIREADCSDGTDEKGMMELSYSIVEKTGRVCDAATDSVERLNFGNTAEVELITIRDDTRDRSEQRESNEESGQVEATDDRSVMNDEAAGPDAVSSSHISVLNSTTLTSDETKVVDQGGLIRQSEDHPEIHSYPDEIVRPRDAQSGTSDGSIRPSPVVECHSADTESCRLEPTRTRSNVEVLEFHSNKSAVDAAIKDEHRFTADEAQLQCDKKKGETEHVVPALQSVEAVDNRRRNTVSDVEELVTDDSESMWNHTQLADTELGPPTTSNDHTPCADHSPTEHALETSVNDVDYFRYKSSCVSTGTDTSYDENLIRTADMSLPTFAQEGTSHEPEQAPEVTASGEEDNLTGQDTAVELRRRKNAVDVESQTEGDKSENPDVVSESTQCTVDSQTMAQHPFSSCTAVNCLVCATVGKNNIFNIV